MRGGDAWQGQEVQTETKLSRCGWKAGKCNN